MTEKINTGGLKTFVYEKSYNPKLSLQEGIELDEAYEKVRIRKKKERKRKIILLIIVIIIFIGGYLLLG